VNRSTWRGRAFLNQDQQRVARTVAELRESIEQLNVFAGKRRRIGHPRVGIVQ
jgi:hypothetical protein